MDRRTFRCRTLPRLREEFGDSLDVCWDEPGAGVTTLPTLILHGRLVHRGGYMVWETLRPIVASALALEERVRELQDEAREALEQLGIEADDWQEGLLSWIARGEHGEGAPGWGTTR